MQPCKVLVVHEFYQKPGGEDEVFRSEVALLERHGHDVMTFTVRNDHISSTNRASLAVNTVWNAATYRQISEVVEKEERQIVHFHNTFPVISPSAYAAAREHGASVVQTLHNYRLLCAGGAFYRGGGVCEDCLHKAVPWPSVVHKCYRGDRLATTVTAAMLAFHNARGTWRHEVDAYIAMTEFSRQKFLQGGLPPARVLVKPHFVDPDPGEGAGTGGYFVFVGRLSAEKGIRVLLDAWRGALGSTARIKVIGDGPFRDELCALNGTYGIEYLGWRPAGEVQSLVGNADALIFPSTCQETFGRAIVEAYAKGTPVIATRLAGTPELVEAGESGLLFDSGAGGLIQAVTEARAPNLLRSMRAAARRRFLDRYTGDRNHDMLIAAYRRAVDNRGEQPESARVSGERNGRERLARRGATRLRSAADSST